MTETSHECERYAPGSRLRAICEGTVDLPLAKINAYRSKMGLGPIQGPDLPRKPRPVAPSRLAKPPEPTPNARGRGRGCGTCGNGRAQGQRRRPPARTNGWGPGSVLLRHFAAAGVPHCDECLALAAEMDRWGKRGCLARLDQLVEKIIPRALAWMKESRPWLHRLLSVTALERTALRLAIRQRVSRAIAEAPGRRPRPKRSSGQFPLGRNWRHSFRPTDGTPAYLSVDDLARDALSLVPRLPPDITHVIGSARSGLVPASLIASMLHLPVSVIRSRPADVMPAGNGWRLLEGAPKNHGRTLVVDDTTMTGNSLLRAKTILKNTGRNGPFVFASVYCNPAAATKPDLWAQDLPWPHLLEWNLFNSVLLDSFALDFDGILCEDCPPADDDDGARYRRFLQEARPLHLVRKRPIKLIVTARLERYRADTLKWMDRWGVRAKEIIMGPWQTVAERRRQDVAAWKADALKRFLAKRGGIPPKFYIESHAGQAARIAELTGRLVVCPPARRCFGKAKR